MLGFQRFKFYDSRFTNMAITSSAKKALRASFNKKVFNVRRKKAMEDAVGEVKKLITAKKISEAKTVVSKAYKAIDKAVKGNTIKKGAGDRKKSRLMALISKAK